MWRMENFMKFSGKFKETKNWLCAELFVASVIVPRKSNIIINLYLYDEENRFLTVGSA